ncbi:peptidase m23 [Lucifera butyrica]|uniref:Peptidase m23 n=1 Tax=Lucifera butyrica TaxID=1351585 RepID=A0A498R7W8_9FIRM|nr:M23 family metallopeptidase [Lucifera butyrica]VBB06372.1 peptidase m23 [Lucifera butyrica]
MQKNIIKKKNVLLAAVMILAGSAAILMAGSEWIQFHPAAPAYQQPFSEPAVREQPITSALPLRAKKEPAAGPVLKKHIVQNGETLSGIAGLYHIDVDTILGANPEAGEMIHPGEELIILPAQGILHTVKQGETIWDLARLYEIQVNEIEKVNHRTDDKILPGEKLFIPGGRPRTANAVSRAAVNRFLWPTQGTISSPFGYRWGKLHAGVDIANDAGTVVRAAGYGKVIFTGWYGDYGYAVMIDHGQNLVTLYGHLSRYMVGVGQYVRAGQVIAYMGSTGNSTGPHLHFEVRRNGQPINPLTVLP